jgi:hypothetical protein
MDVQKTLALLQAANQILIAVTPIAMAAAEVANSEDRAAIEAQLAEIEGRSEEQFARLRAKLQEAAQS